MSSAKKCSINLQEVDDELLKNEENVLTAEKIVLESSTQVGILCVYIMSFFFVLNIRNNANIL